MPKSPRRPLYFSPSPSPLMDSSSAKMPLCKRILRSVIVVGLVVLFIAIVSGGVLYSRGECLASLDMGGEPIEVEQLQPGLEAKVDLYYSEMTRALF